MIKTKVGYVCWHIGVDEQKGSMQCSICKIGGKHVTEKYPEAFHY